MNSNNIQQQAAEVLNQGVYLDDHWVIRPNSNEAEAVLGTLAAAGLLAPDLPRDNVPPFGSGEWSAGFEYVIHSNKDISEMGNAHSYAWAPGRIGFSAPRIMDTDQAEGLALAILAAVKADRRYHANQEKNQQ
ncbi:hypothetical protein [Corynebacterium sp. A21]|uniref:hypothetical protein n=1 Tax=Corynebacterium sp. A21 TaxID=3457318 RepID=UPI003FCFF5E3